MADVEDGLGRVEIGVRAGLAVRTEGLLQRRRSGGRAEPGVAVHVRRPEARLADDGERVVLLQEELARRVEPDRAGGKAVADFRDRSASRPIASSQLASSRTPPRRISGRVSRSGLLFASQPWRPLGPSRPRLTRSEALPRHADDPPAPDAEVEPATVGAQHAGRWHPPLGILRRSFIHPDRPSTVAGIRRSRPPDVVDAVPRRSHVSPLGRPESPDASPSDFLAKIAPNFSGGREEGRDRPGAERLMGKFCRTPVNFEGG